MLRWQRDGGKLWRVEMGEQIGHGEGFPDKAALIITGALCWLRLCRNANGGGRHRCVALLSTAEWSTLLIHQKCTCSEKEKMAKLIPAEMIEKTLKGIVIPARPQALLHLQNELKKDDPAPRVIVRLISGDVGLSAAVLQTVNSPFFGLSRKISSVAQAVSLLGMKAAAQIVTGLGVEGCRGGQGTVAGTFLGQRRKSCRHCQLHRIDHPQGASRRRLLLRTVPRRGHSDPDAEIPGLPADAGAGGQGQQPAIDRRGR
ncbi:HDOD domain-containing protein [Candidatus Accumulibacter phosphatis]|uniref:HDOD domain-containing protein n=1 Tax=Candidatus Accumulibacter contiguus TaxID=2954381 RepID=A0ABX1T6J8_9PROT|nr:HDOD domain-containing protein [Candidatus Accumulibacter contiguus]